MRQYAIGDLKKRRKDVKAVRFENTIVHIHDKSFKSIFSPNVRNRSKKYDFSLFLSRSEYFGMKLSNRALMTIGVVDETKYNFNEYFMVSNPFNISIDFIRLLSFPLFQLLK